MKKLDKISKSLKNKILIDMNLTLSEKKMKEKQDSTCFIQRDRRIEEPNL